ncbi:MAG: fibronectin type III domain-containing protein [Verrucomicrobiota bacterium]
MPNGSETHQHHAPDITHQKLRPRQKWKTILSRCALVVVLAALGALCQSAASAQVTVTLRWDPSPSATVGGYRIYYGGGSGLYTNTVTAGNVTVLKLNGLEEGRTYFFVVSAYDATGYESDFSNEASYTTPTLSSVAVPALQLLPGAGGEMTLLGTALPPQTYDVQASTDLREWIVLERLTVAGNGLLNFTDSNAWKYPSRFYRLIETRPDVQLQITVGQLPTVVVIGQGGRTYEVQVSTNLTAWAGIGSVTLGGDGQAELVDIGAAGVPVRYYRTREISL